jgi:hypothetical protein
MLELFTQDLITTREPSIKSWSGQPWNAVSVRKAMVRLGFQTTARHDASPRR